MGGRESLPFSPDSIAVIFTLLLTVSTSLAPTPTKDLAKVYAGTLDHVEGAGAVAWTAGLDDVWKLKEFEYVLPNKLELKLGPSTVVVGKHDGETTGRSAVWAAVFPEEPAAIVSSEPGHGEHVSAIYLRFHPQQIGALFPARTVHGQGDPIWLLRGRRQAGHKMQASWQWDNLPMVPTRESLIFDIDTVEGPRRFYSIDRAKPSIQYVGAFAERQTPQPSSVALRKGEAKAALQKVWSTFDKEYAMFAIKPDVDWKKLKKRYEPLAAKVDNPMELAELLGALLAHLQDLHVFVRQQNHWVPTYNRFRVTNGNWQVTKSKLSNLQEGKGLAYGKIQDRIGYLVVWNLTQEGLSDAFDEALEALRATEGLILDLRFNGGGNEVLGQRIAGRFIDQKAVYSFSQYRKGPKHDDLSEKLPRSVEPRGPWRFEAPVVVLQGQKTMSSAESLVLMLAQAPNVTTLGDHTAGSSGNPRSLELTHGIVVNVPRWVDLDHEGQPIDGVGVAPQVSVAYEGPGDFRNADPVIEAAIQRL